MRKLPLTVKGNQTVIFGGSYLNKPDHLNGVKMAEEIDMPYLINVPTRDFSVPNEEVLKQGVAKAIGQLNQGKTFYVGCMGGVGRTGLFMAVLAKTLKVKNPIQYVRDQYNPHAVETKQQEDYVNNIDVSLLSKVSNWL